MLALNMGNTSSRKKKTEQDEDKEEGEVVKDIVIIDEEKGSYVSGSWGPKDEETKEGFSFKGKKKEFLQAALEVQGLFYTNKEHEILFGEKMERRKRQRPKLFH